MQKSLQILQKAQLALNALDAERAEENDDALHTNDFRSRLLVADGGNGLHVQYDGEVWEDAMEIALNAIAKAAPDIVSLKLMGPDEGANGSRTHDFSALLNTTAIFPNLLALTIRPTDCADHNFVDVESGQLPDLIDRCPYLEQLTLPCAPEADFFKVALKNCWYLRIGMGFQLHNFIDNLANSSLIKNSNLPKLSMFDFSDSLSVFQSNLPKDVPVTPPNLANNIEILKGLGYSETDIKDMDFASDAEYAQSADEVPFDDSYTSFAAYEALFTSKALKERAVFHLRNALLTQEQFLQLEKMRPDLQFSASIEAPHVYVSHWQGKFASPYQHLIIPH